MSFFSLSDTGDRSGEQARVSNNAQYLRQAESIIARQRVQAVYFIYTGNIENANNVRDLSNKALVVLDQLIASFRSAERRQKAVRIKEMATLYAKDFERVVEIRTRRDELVDKGLTVIGHQARSNLTQLADQAMKSRSFEVAALAGKAEHHLMCPLNLPD